MTASHKGFQKSQSIKAKSMGIPKAAPQMPQMGTAPMPAAPKVMGNAPMPKKPPMSPQGSQY